MKNRHALPLIFWLSGMLALIMASCQEPGTVVPTITGTAEASITHVDRDGSLGTFEYSQDLGSTPKDVFFILTNTTTVMPEGASTISSNMDVDRSTPEIMANSLGDNQMELNEYAKDKGIGLRGTPEISRYNANPPALIPRENLLFKMYEGDPQISFSSIGDPHTFYEQLDSQSVAATLRDTTTDGPATVYLWVADDSWDASDDVDCDEGACCSKAYCMGPTKLSEFTQQFLKSGSDNDIYNWTTNIFGDPWGSHTYDNLISDTSTDIHILFYDISDDNSTSGGYLGYFWSGDTFTSQSRSNQRLLFYMDSVLTATKDDATWEASDPWPAEMISTLAHEFQHMINFYQKNIVRSSSSQTWLNEMCSMIAEDLLASKMNVNGPRGVSYADDTAGSPGNQEGRLPRYNRYHYTPLTYWDESTIAQILKSYATSYSFGAYLARNYGGANLFQKIVQNANSDYQAVETALSALGYTETFGTLLQKWGAAVLQSDSQSQSAGYRFNSGTSFDSTLNGVPYNLGSINLYNYSFTDGATTVGPYLFETDNLPSGHYQTSNTFVSIGQDLTGDFSRRVTMPSGVKLTVILKDSN